MKKKIIIPTLVLGALFLAGVCDQNTASADGGSGRETIVQKIAEKFSLDEDEVREVFSRHRKERRQEIIDKFNERLDRAVAIGKITNHQKQTILNKKKELWQSCDEVREELKDLSPQERWGKRKQYRGEMKQWMDENGIDLRDKRAFFGSYHRIFPFLPKF